MLITEIEKSVKKLQEFTNSAKNTKNILDSLLLANKISIVKKISSDFKFTKGINNTLSWLKKYEPPLQNNLQLLSNFADISQFSLTDIPLKQQPKGEKPTQVNIFVVNTTIEESPANKNTIKEKPKSKNNKIHEKGVIGKQKNMLRVIDELIVNAAIEGVMINKREMPGTKSEFIEVLKYLAPEHFKQSYSRLLKYLPKMGLTFRPGIHKNKCLIMKKIRTIVGLPQTDI
ncbi:TPA: hypothetical protein JBA76_15805 [Legionella pneumophila subsp. pneumophila]|uniref:hypothetical protein n=1 Tax=Legionella pneumophila TaxID=446 RepID=UPI000770AE02|nr:hypothetical protein [Legionella pneumophila]HAT8850753.1 hypothetical protein [Legionella pneumophila subsp. pneumophila]CZI81505.1 Uncharacterised protein [Legionella pneumophila]CZI83350.1 Uncharacterised protein [Legionella pneumophila]HAT9170699.1 hypothetical protein [Legionella pneumophila subsp. pneumophila]HDP0036720.1 hypothetical protein [Legionella pneumophila]